MALTRISTYNVHQSTLRDVSRVQRELFELQNQVSSGLKADSFAQLSGQVEQFVSLETRITKTKEYSKNNDVAVTRLNSTNAALDIVIQAATDLKNQILLRRNESFGAQGVFDEQLDAAWKGVSNQLNMSVEGRYLFSGTQTNEKAVDDENFPTLVEVGVPDDGYYLGSQEDITLRADDSFDLTYNVRADEAGFQKLYAGIATAKEGHEANDDALLKQAYDLVQSGLQEIIATQATVNANKVTITQFNERHESLRLYWQGVKEDVINTDMVSASTQVAINQGVLLASFQTFARISSLRLSDYL